MNSNDDRPMGSAPLHEDTYEDEVGPQETRGPTGGAENDPADDPAAAHTDQGGHEEVEILRAELRNAAEERDRLEEELREAKADFLRARAEQDTMRRRMLGEVEVARNEGVASALAPALNVFDDLERALAAAEVTDDPASIVPGVRAVRDSLLRNLAGLDVTLTGLPGEQFDPNLHEALSVVKLRQGAVPGTIDQVFEAGFTQGERLVRPARVTVFAEDDR